MATSKNLRDPAGYYSLCINQDDALEPGPLNSIGLCARYAGALTGSYLHLSLGRISLEMKGLRP